MIWPSKKKKKNCRPVEVQEELDNMNEDEHGRVFKEAQISKKMKGKL